MKKSTQSAGRTRLAYSTGGEATPTPDALAGEMERRTKGVRIRLERRASGRMVTVLADLPGTRSEIEALATALKKRCGTGGSVRGLEIELQGDKRAGVQEVLTEKGFPTNRRAADAPSRWRRRESARRLWESLRGWLGYTGLVSGSAARRLTRGRLFVLSLYVLVALVTPLLHHDVACHLQSRSHCVACTSNPVASGIEATAAPPGHSGPLLPSPQAEAVAQACPARPSPPGRAPPTEPLFV